MKVWLGDFNCESVGLDTYKYFFDNVQHLKSEDYYS